MKESYEDITSSIEKKPLWWDENGTPRYWTFDPNITPDVYAREAVLMLVRCQNCGTEFDVSLTSSALEYSGGPKPHLDDLIRSGMIHYGDPPNTFCCPPGASMNSIPVKVLQYWKRDRDAFFGWKRVTELEVEIEDKFGGLSPEELEAYNHTHEEE